MRDLVFKNLTSLDKQRRVLASSEVVDKKGVRSIIRRHFVCLLKEVDDPDISRPLPYLYVFRKQNSLSQEEKFFCRIKGSLHAVINGRLFLILFMHSLKIGLAPVPLGVKGM